MRAGKLRHPIVIEAPSGAQDEYGEPVEGWTPFATAMASREDLAGREAFAAQAVRADVTTRFELRYLAGVTANMRVVSEGVPYNIVSAADPEGRGRTLVLTTAREG